MKCSICNHEIVLSPSAAERAKRYGGKANDYVAIFQTHAECMLAKRDQETRELMRAKKPNHWVKL